MPRDLHPISCAAALMLLAVLLAVSPIRGDAPLTTRLKFDERFEDWPIDLSIRGTVVVVPDWDERGELDSLLVRPSGPGAARIVGLSWRALSEAEREAARQRFESAESVDLIVVDPGAEALPVELEEKVRGATGVLLTAGNEQAEQARRHILALRTVLQELIGNGGTLVAEGALSGLLARRYLAADEPASTPVAEGLGLIPDSLVQLEYSPDDDGSRLRKALADSPRSVGIGLQPNTALILRGRKLQVLGTGAATFLLSGNGRMPEKVQTIRAPQSPRQRPKEYLIDLTQWRREAIDRTIEPFPPLQPDNPYVENGTLVIVGGGGMPAGLMARFVELAGGPDQARLVYVPCSENERVPEKQGMVELWKSMGVRHATFIHTKDRRQADRDPHFLAPLKDATGIWFGGGRQWNFADSYYGTQAHRLMKEVVRRGGVVGGSSAGASIQARYLARATPIENFDIMAPGYERGGLGFISGVAIDQHFSQRRRQEDMSALVNRYPQLLGIGIDEATALVVRESIAEVVGRGKVFFYDRRRPVEDGQPDYTALPAGSRFDLATRQTLAECP